MPKSTQNTTIDILPPPVITILGHVDHGKTTLLDTIRKTRVAQKEFGGITQKIGAYQIDIPPNPKNKAQVKKITFIDTPGHVAFTQMRSQGALVADIAVLVVAGNDGIMPQTIESITHIKNSQIPVIVAINKMDLPDINLEKIKKQLSKQGLNLEEYGGDVPVVPISAKKEEGIDKLLSTIILIHELYYKKASTSFSGVVIESALTKTKGIVATIIVRSGNLAVGDEVVSTNNTFKIRALLSDTGINRTVISRGDPAEVLGFKSLPEVGSTLYKINEAELNKPVQKTITAIQPETVAPEVSASEQPPSEDKIKLIVKADTAGSLEAISLSLKSDVMIISNAVGNINESDVLLAKTTKALIIGFNVTPPDNVTKLAASEKVLIKTYNLIYQLIDELEELIEAIRKGNLVTILGEAKINVIFNIKKEKIAGVKVVKGRIARGDQVKIMREETEISRAKIKSLRHGKEDISKVEQGTEAGVLLSHDIDFLTGDSIISIG